MEKCATRTTQLSMNWKYKAFLQLAFSNIPFGESLNYFFQRYVKRSLPISDTKFTSIVSSAKKHIGAVKEFLRCQLSEAIFYEFGAGWNLVIPLALYAFGVERQILVDIRNLLRPKLVNDSIEKFQRIALDVTLLRKPNQFLSEKRDFLISLKKYYGIEYRAPCDARDTGLETCSIDFVTSTNTLEHIHPQDIQAILRECHRILKDDGLISLLIDYKDHYAYFDRAISVYNFLRYSDRVWAFFNPALHYQNRLRHRNYLELFEMEGFEILKSNCIDGTVADLEIIERLPIDKRFRTYSSEELSVRSSHVILHKQRIKTN
jgi:SAM-dependent methyltransferase